MTTPNTIQTTPTRTQTTYMAKWRVNNKNETLTTTNYDAFKTAVRNIEAAFPNLKCHIFEITEQVKNVS